MKERREKGRKINKQLHKCQKKNKNKNTPIIFHTNFIFPWKGVGL